MEPKDILQNYREQIDSLDAELLYLLSRRFEIVTQVWELKVENDIPFLQSNRWNEVLNEKIEMWAELKISKSFIEDVWNRIHDEALKIEKSTNK